MKNKERSPQTFYIMSSKASKNKGEASNETFDEEFQKLARLSCYDDSVRHSAQTETRHVLLGTPPHQFASKNYIATQDNLCQIENNFDFVKVLACFGKCSNASSSRNVNIKITNNFKVVMICQNFTFDILPNELKGQLKSKLENGEATTREERLFFPWKEHEDDPETFSSAENIHQTGRNFVYTRRRFDGFSMASSKNDDFTRISLEKPASVMSDGSTKEKAKVNQNVPTCTLSTEADFKSYVARGNSPLQIESNFGIVIIAACGKCNNDFAEDSKGPALENPPENVNINITRNNGVVMVCQNGHFNLYVQPDIAIEKMERKVQDEDISLERQRIVLSEQEVEERHLLLDANNTKQVGILSASSGDCGNVNETYM